MKTIIAIILLFVCSVCYPYEIVVYGVNSCGYTTNLRNELTAKNITFTYCDVNGMQCWYDMQKVANDFNLIVNNTVYFPIVKVVVDGVTTGLCRPLLADIVKLIGTTGIREITFQNGIIHSPGKIDVYNLQGVKILHSDNQEMDISNLPKGVYVVNGIKIIK
jgi:hypothetical protein